MCCTVFGSRYIWPYNFPPTQAVLHLAILSPSWPNWIHLAMRRHIRPWYFAPGLYVSHLLTRPRSIAPALEYIWPRGWTPGNIAMVLYIGSCYVTLAHGLVHLTMMCYTCPSCVAPDHGGLHLAILFYTWPSGVAPTHDVSHLASLP